MHEQAEHKQAGHQRAGKLVLLALVGLGCLSNSAGVNARTTTVAESTCQTISRTQVIALFDKWNRALLTKRTDVVVAEYAPNATLLPTVQNGPLSGSEIAKYFEYFLKQSPSAIVDTRVIQTGCNVAYDIGLYTFKVDGDQPGSRKEVKARYTFIYVPMHGKWLITHQHSSAVPVPP